MQPRSKALLTAVGLGVMILALALLVAKKIDLMTADLGRHLANGRWLCSDWSVLSTNFYAHDFAMTPFVNHHWLSGVVFHAVHSVAGFPGLSLAYIALTCAAFTLMAVLAVRQSSAAIGLGLSLLLLPLVAFRTEVRPEGFSYFFCALFLWILTNARSGRYGRRALLLLPLLMIVWVNLHIYFVFGLVLILAFLTEAWLSPTRPARPPTLQHWDHSNHRVALLGSILGLSLIAALINPFGWRLAIYPLNIFDNYGYLIAENQTVWFLERLGMSFPVFGPLYVATALFWLTMLAVPWRLATRPPLGAIVVAAMFSAMALLGIRNISLFGLIALPVMAEVLNSHRRVVVLGLILPLAAGSTWSFAAESWQQWPQRFGLGLVDPDHAPAVFFKSHKLKGPVFNNYDIGGYLIYHLYPETPPFVDNRPEAYPPGFFQDVYVPMQEVEARWKQEQDHYQFNSIFFYWHDMTPAAQTFLLARVHDPEWVPVYVDAAAIIFLRNTALNQNFISHFAVPRERFSVR